MPAPNKNPFVPHTRRTFLRGLAGAATASLGLSSLTSAKRFSSGGKRRERPNVLFVMSDQHNARAMGRIGSGEVLTPTLDGLAKQGMQFTSAFCQIPQCAPSRYTIWTGKHPRSHGLVRNGLAENMREVTIGELFKAAGYRTANIGKHHMVESPKAHGFDFVRDAGGHTQFWNKVRQAKGGEFVDWIPLRSKMVGSANVSNSEHLAGHLADGAIEYLRTPTQEPFCMWLSFYGPHRPIIPSAEFVERYDPDKLTLPPNLRYEARDLPRALTDARGTMSLTDELHRQCLATYYGYVSQIDYNVGRVLDALESTGQADNTIVVYTSDHGEMMSEHGVWTKFNLAYDATVRVPLLIRYPDVIPADRRSDALVGLYDLLPTLCGQSGIATPDSVQGTDLAPLWSEEDPKWRSSIVAEIGDAQGYPGLCQMARSSTAKYIKHQTGRRITEQLFDLKSDPWEIKNVAGQEEYGQTLSQLRQVLTQFEADIPRQPTQTQPPANEPERK